MARGAFIVFRDEGDERDIHFKVASTDGEDIPEDQLVLRDRIDQTLTVLRELFDPDDRRFEEYFRPLLSLAQTGLVGDAAQPDLASRALMQLREQVVAQEGGRIKNQYMRRLGAVALAFAIAAALLSAMCHAASLPALRGYSLLWTGAMVGVWLSFGVRKLNLRFDELHMPEQDRLEPAVRLAFAGGLTMVVGLLFATHGIVVTIGPFESWQFKESIEIGLLIGVLCGVCEQALSTKIAGQAARIFDFG